MVRGLQGKKTPFYRLNAQAVSANLLPEQASQTRRRDCLTRLSRDLKAMTAMNQMTRRLKYRLNLPARVSQIHQELDTAYHKINVLEAK